MNAIVGRWDVLNECPPVERRRESNQSCKDGMYAARQWERENLAERGMTSQELKVEKAAQETALIEIEQNRRANMTSRELLTASMFAAIEAKYPQKRSFV